MTVIQQAVTAVTRSHSWHYRQRIGLGSPSMERVSTIFVRLGCVVLALVAGAGAHAAPDYDAFVAQGNALLQAGDAGQALSSGESAIKISADRWEGYALAGSALMNLKRYEPAADALSKAIERAPESKQPALRDLRRQCLLAESGYPSVANSSGSAATGAGPDAQVQRENERKRLVAKLTWTDPATGLMWAKYSRPSEYAHASFTRANDYCAALRALGYADWRLPSVVEFTHIYHFAADSATVQLDGDLAINKDILRYLGFWTSTPGDQDGEHVLVFEGKSVSSSNVDGEGRVGGWLAGHSWNGAIVCVRVPKAAEER
jgi:tetratricopeptide (TPR) repeat protein